MVDAALPISSMPRPVDRRKLVTLVLAGATGAALVEAGIPMIREMDGLSALDSLQRMTASLADAYDTAGPLKIASYVPRLEHMAAGVLADRSLPAAGHRDAKAAYAQLLTLSANATGDIGDHAKSARTGDLAASLAIEIGDAQAAGHALSVVSGALLAAGDQRRALAAARRARGLAGSSPSAVMALAAEATVAAEMGRPDVVLGLVGDAEAEHAKIPPRMWGEFGVFHAAHVKAFAGSALNKVGMYGEAAPRLAEAADLARGTGLAVFVWLAQSSALLGSGNTDGAHELAAAAVASAETRPSAWVAQSVANLDRRSGGAFAGLVGRTSRWGFVAAR